MTLWWKNQPAIRHHFVICSLQLMSILNYLYPCWMGTPDFALFCLYSRSSLSDNIQYSPYSWGLRPVPDQVQKDRFTRFQTDTQNTKDNRLSPTWQSHPMLHTLVTIQLQELPDLLQQTLVCFSCTFDLPWSRQPTLNVAVLHSSFSSFECRSPIITLRLTS